MLEAMNQHRRRFLGAAAMTLAAAPLAMIGSAAAQSSKPKSAHMPAIKPGSQHLVRLTEADRRRPAERRIR